MKVDVYMRWYLGDYLRDTTDLTAEEHGAYLLILAAMWLEEGRLPVSRLARVARVAPERWESVWQVLQRFFQIAEGIATQGRLLRELEAATAAREQAKVNGRLGGRPKLIDADVPKPDGKPDGNRPGNRNETSSSVIRHPSSVIPQPAASSSDLLARGRAVRAEYPPAFEAVWEATAKTGSKAEAMAAWKACGMPSADVVGPAWRRWTATRQWREGFVPHVRRWLRGRCWEQDPVEVMGRSAQQTREDRSRDAILDWAMKKQQGGGT